MWLSGVLFSYQEDSGFAPSTWGGKEEGAEGEGIGEREEEEGRGQNLRPLQLGKEIWLLPTLFFCPFHSQFRSPHGRGLGPT